MALNRLINSIHLKNDYNFLHMSCQKTKVEQPSLSCVADPAALNYLLYYFQCLMTNPKKQKGVVPKETTGLFHSRNEHEPKTPTKKVVRALS